MYCPVCFNNTLKIASSGVVKVAFNGKAKPTSQFMYNLKTESQEEINKKFENVVLEYFNWYKTLQNRDPIKSITLNSCDFVCSEGCKLTLNHMLNVVDLVIPVKDYTQIAKGVSDSTGITVQLPLKRQF